MTYDKNQIYPEYIIYKLCSDECDLFYVGSTRNMAQRKKCHKTRSQNTNDPSYNQKTYKTIREFGGWDEWRMVPLEKMENVSRFQAECREEVVRVDLNAKLNSKRASCGGITLQEYREENKEMISKSKEKYRINNRELINQKYYCECGGLYTRSNKAKHFKSKIHKRYLERIE